MQKQKPGALTAKHQGRHEVMKRENNTGIIIGITAAAAAILAIMIAGLVFVLPIVKEKCTDLFVEKKLEQGYEYLSQQDYKPAIAAFNTVVKVDDQRTEAYIGLGDAYSGQKEDIQLQTLTNLISDTETEIREGMKMS